MTVIIFCAFKILFHFPLGFPLFLIRSQSWFFVALLYVICHFCLAAFKIFVFTFGSQKPDYDASRCVFRRFAELLGSLTPKFSSNLGNFNHFFFWIFFYFIFSLHVFWDFKYICVLLLIIGSGVTGVRIIQLFLYLYSLNRITSVNCLQVHDSPIWC